MKKTVSLLLAAVLALSFAACGNDGGTEKTPIESSAVLSQPGETPQQTSSGGLTLLCDDSSSFSNHFGTESGFYYFTESGRISDGLSGMHLMYIDYATKQEIYLCSDSGCRHDSDSCGSVYAQGEFGIDCLPFVWDNSLYVLSRDYDSDGSSSFDMMGGASSPEATAVSLYRMCLDGSARQKLYTFPDNVSTEKLVFGDGDALWFVTKILETQSDAAGSYTTSTDRSLSKFSIPENKIVDSISLDFGDNIYHTVVGASDSTFVLSGVAYQDGMSEAEAMRLSDDQWKLMYENSSTVYSSLDAASKSKTEIYRLDNRGFSSTCAVKDGALFVADCVGGGITKINFTTGESSRLAGSSQYYIYFAMDDTLCCANAGGADDKTLYFVDMETGEAHNSTLTNMSLGLQLDVLAEASDNVLVVYDYDVTQSGDQYTIDRYKYALISKDALYRSQANYMPITMAGIGK